MHEILMNGDHSRTRSKSKE